MDMMKKTEVFNGWIGKSWDVLRDPLVSFCNVTDRMSLYVELFNTKGDQQDWKIQDWPPKKARITITLETGQELKIAAR